MRKGPALLLGTAMAGLLAFPQMAEGQTRAAQASVPVGNALAYDSITPNLQGQPQEIVTTADEGAAHNVTGQAEAVAPANPYATFSYDEDVTYTQPDGQRASRRDLANTSAGRYYGTAYSGGDLVPVAYSPEDSDPAAGKSAMRSRRLGVFDQTTADKRRISVHPYIEAGQVVQGDFGTPHDVLTYSVVAVGGDVTVNGRNNQGVISARYERRFGWNRKADGDGITGIARLSSAIVPDTLRIDYGGYANRTYLTDNGTAVPSTAYGSDSLTQIYGAFGGPTLTTHVGDVAVTGHYHAGYTAVDSRTTTTTATTTAVGDTLNHSVVQDARLAVGTRPGDALPVGLGADAGFYQEDVANLSQRVLDKHVRGEITIPVATDTALVGGIGYEHVQISSRDAIYDAAGAPEIDNKGRYITDYSQPRKIAYDTQGLIWDAGVVWRPSRRTNLEAHVGRRYGQIGGYGFFNWQPNDHSSFNLAVYQGITGFGGALTSSLFGLSSEFSTIRDSITGNLSSCVSSMAGGGCMGGSLASANSTLYRSRGVMASYQIDFHRWRAGLGAGYDRRQYITAQNTVLADANGKVDQYYWATGFVGYQLTEFSNLRATLDVYRYQSGLTSNGNLTAARAVALYQYYLSRHLTANASLGLDVISRDSYDDLWAGSGAVGMRYTF